jgi:long-chain acyl-CoA synthetase
MPLTAPALPSEFPRSLNYPEVAVGSIPAGAAARFGDRTAFIHHDAQLSYTELYSAACRFANALLERGIGHGDVVAIHLPNCLAYPVAYYGILLAGATFSPANPLLPPKDLAAQLADCGAVAVVTFGPVAKVVASVLDHTSVKLVVVSSPAAELTKPDVSIDIYDDLAHISYTGGTTGRSKGVLLPHRNVVVNTLQYCCWSSGSLPALDDAGGLRLDQVGSADEWPSRVGTGITINLTPWFHAMGTIAALNGAVLGGTTVVLHDRFDPAAYLADAERLRVTSLGGAPALFAALLASPGFQTHDLSSVLGIGSGAAPLAHEMINALQRRFPGVAIAEGYGLTEVTMGATGAPTYHSGVRKVGSVGVPIYDTEVKIVPAEGGEEALPAGTEGEVCIRGPQVMIGYLNRPEDTAAALVDGWFHTGDIGVLDDDGYLSIVDRKKDMLLYKGYNVYPRELEELLIAEPAVAGAAVVGRPNAEVGELPVAFVVRAPGHESTSAGDLIESINGKVLPYKRIRELIFVEQIPVSAAGKVLKRELRQQL